MRSVGSRFRSVILVHLLWVASAHADDAKCLHDSPLDAMYQIVARQCTSRDGLASKRLSTGVRIGDVIYATLHGVIGCAEVVGYPECKRVDYQEVVLKPVRLSKSSDLVQLAPATGTLKGAALRISSGVKVDDPLKLCGYPKWNSSYATCSDFIAYQPGQLNQLTSLLRDSGDTETKLAVEAFDIPTRTKMVMRHEALGGDGFSGGPLVHKRENGGTVVALHDGRFTADGVVRYWAIPLFPVPGSIIWEDWATRRVEMNAMATQTPVKGLHFAVETASAVAPPGVEEVQQFLTAVFASVLRAYPCEWGRLGGQVLNNVCSTSGISCAQSQGRTACDAACVLKIYEKRVAELASVAKILCHQVATKVGVRDEDIGCTQPEKYAWFVDNADYRYGQVFSDVPQQAKLMRELYFTAVRPERRSQFIAQLVEDWKADAAARGVTWRLADAQQRFQNWAAIGAAPWSIFASNGEELQIEPSRKWNDLVPELVLFVLSYIASDTGHHPRTSCANGRLRLSDGAWRYQTGRCTFGDMNCLQFLGSERGITAYAKEVASALAFGGASNVQATLSPSPIAGAQDGQETHDITVGGLHVDGLKESIAVEIRSGCGDDGTGEGKVIRRSTHVAVPPNDKKWIDTAKVTLSEQCPWVDVRVNWGSRRAKRFLVTVPLTD